jgi:hypothetical protein
MGQRIRRQQAELFSTGFLAWVAGVTPQAMRLYLGSHDVSPDVLIHGDNGRVTGAFYETTVRRIMQQRASAGLSAAAATSSRGFAQKANGRHR